MFSSGGWSSLDKIQNILPWIRSFEIAKKSNVTNIEWDIIFVHRLYYDNSKETQVCELLCPNVKIEVKSLLFDNYKRLWFSQQ